MKTYILITEFLQIIINPKQNKPTEVLLKLIPKSKTSLHLTPLKSSPTNPSKYKGTNTLNLEAFYTQISRRALLKYSRSFETHKRPINCLIRFRDTSFLRMEIILLRLYLRVAIVGKINFFHGLVSLAGDKFHFK